MSGDVRRQIAEALAAKRANWIGDDGQPNYACRDTAADLLPVVERIARQRAADELRAAAQEVADVKRIVGSPAPIAAMLRARADALTADAQP